MGDNQTLIILKVTVMVLFFSIVMFFGTLPIRIKSFKKRPLLRAIGGTFAGCLFINVSILHILPQAADTLEQFLKGDNPQKDVFPLAYLLLMVGFIITVFFTKVLAAHSHGDEDHSHGTHQGHGAHDHQHDHDHDHNSEKNQHTNKEDTITKHKSSQQIKQSLLSEPTTSLHNIVQSQKLTSPNHKNDDSSSNMLSQSDASSSQGFHSQNSLHLHRKKKWFVLNDAFILTIAMYFHTIFEGIAIGVQDSITGFLSTAVAIAFHKWADALSMGLHYKTKSISKRTSYILIIIQAVLNVTSIGLGWVIQQSGAIAEAVFLSISAGTFLAISTMEMLGEQFHHRQYMHIKFLLLLGATAFVSAIWFLENSIFGEN